MALSLLWARRARVAEMHADTRLWVAAFFVYLLPTSAVPQASPSLTLQVRVDSTQAEAALDLLAARARGETVPASSWTRVFESEGYRRTLERELAIDERLGIDRGYSNESFLVWAESDAALEGLAARKETLAAWADVDVDAAAARAKAYLPPDVRLVATVYPIVRRQLNSFVWDLPDNPAIFMAVGTDVSAEELELTLAHELHHVGLSGVCEKPESAAGDRVAAARDWLSGFGEGLAVLAAGGGPDGNTHAVGQADLRTAWQERQNNVEADMRQLEAFLLDVAEGRTEGEDARRQGMAFVSAEGVPQGAFYSLGWFMAVVVERHLGREAVVAATCDHGRLLTDYQRIATTHSGERYAERPLPTWSERFLRVLRLGDDPL